MGSTPTVRQLLSRLQEQENFPAISKHISELSSKASPTSESSARELAALILRDYSLTSRLLKVANSAMYGQFSGTISTISRAVVVLGFEQVQLTAAGLIFFEHLQDKAKSHFVKEAVLSAFLSGILARDLARNMKFEGWENYYIGAMFHNFGRLLALYYFPEEFSAFTLLINKEKLDEETACRKTLGVTFAELGIEVAKSWSLPDQIIVSMKMVKEADLNEDAKKINHQQFLPRCACELCDITMNVPVAERREALLGVLQKYWKVYPVRQNEIIAMMDEAIKEMQKFTDILRLDRTDLERLGKRSFHAEDVQEQKSAKDQAPSTALSLQRFEVAESPQAAERLTTPEERKRHLQGGIQEVTNVILEDFSLDEVLSIILETIFRGIGFDRVIIFFKDPRSDNMLARYGLGQNATNIIKGFGFSLDAKAADIFNLAIRENKDLYIGNVSAPEIRDLCPSWFKGPIFCPSLALYPILINKKPIGLIYGGHDDPGEHLDMEQLGAIKTLRNQAALAIKQSFSG